MKKILIPFVLLMTLAFCPNDMSAQSEYKAAVGLRAAWGFALTGKVFLPETNHAIEGIINRRSFGFGIYDYGWLSFTGLYQIHDPLDDVVEGLQWYYGGGLNFTTYTGDFDYPDSNLDSFFGIAGCIGLDYKFEDVPINVSADWIPVIGFGNYGFGAEGGGVAVRYTF
ncbi:MAG: hypothetical protein R3275_03695 [Saprospiraceae bacterium]|nr:hypothetical protein [Saprospiraceae bacterium]